MGRLVEKHDKHYMKMAMLKQEETFKAQVSELHRLYRVQKQLMREMKNTSLKRQHESKNLERWNSGNSKTYSYQDREKPRLVFDLERPAEEYTEEDNGGVALLEMEQEDDVQLTLATGGSSWTKKTETSDSGATFSSSSTDSGGSNLKLNKWASFQRPVIVVPTDRESGFAAMEPKEKHSWRFQCLSLSMT